MAKNKERKKTDDEIRVINCFKKYVENCALRTNNVQSVSFYEQTSKNNFRLVATLDCGDFKQKIIYYPEMLFEEHFIDTELLFDSSDYRYMFYDIFNLFDIEDFNLYYYSGLISEEDVENAVKSIFEATEKYLYYLEKAGTDYYLPDLKKNYETDMDNSYGSSDWREEQNDIDELFFVPANHPLLSFADGKIDEKAIKKLKKKNAKGKLDTIYEKRLLKYIEAGNRVERKSIAENEEFEKLYSRRVFNTNLIVFLVAFAVILTASFAWRSILFKGAEIYPASFHIFGLTLNFPLDKLGLCAFSAFAVMLSFSIFFGKKLVMNRMPEDMKKRAGTKYDKDKSSDLGKFSKPIGIILSLIVLFCGIISFIASVEDIGYYDTYVKYSSDLEFGTINVDYKDLKLYRVNGYYDEDDAYVLNENAYAISDGNGNYYDYGELVKGGKTETKLKEIAEKYNKEITEIETIEALYLDASK